ncbi:UNVERIFIED_CONTAM: Receptor-like protein 9a [Sesamum latifolium]|uniref:Receptor-like protein 9a n=1 Tax=Sesamum latifolium TaxID=2727402 RepID=A0AAW2XDR2_9LAMI
MDALSVFVCWVLFGSVIIQLEWSGSLGCIEEERIGLLKLKAAFNPPNVTASAFLSWVGGDMDCCMWENVRCDYTTKRVVQLSLNDTKYDRETILATKILEWWYLDFSLFLPFQELQNLSLAQNFLKGFHGVLRSSKLQYFGLKVQEFNSLNNLSTFEDLCKLRNLQELDLSNNAFEGILPLCLSNLTSLRVLELSWNLFTGSIPPNLFSNLQSLEYVSLSYNHFEGSVSFSSFGNNSRLQVFELDSHNKELNVYTESPYWKPLFQLKVFRLSNCILNKPDRKVPSFLWNQHDLRVVNLSDNGMTGEALTWLIKNNLKLECLSLRNNRLTGEFSLHPDSRNVDMFWLDASVNQIQGELPYFLGSVLPNMLLLNLSRNALRGTIPACLGDLRKLESLDLSNNNFSGKIPQHLFMGCVSLRFLKLSNNNLQGQLLPEKSNLTALVSLYLDNNHFFGELSHGLHNSPYLTWLDISNNNISGKFPDWISDFEYLSTLVLSRNSLEGTMPLSLCNVTRLRFLDLSLNNLTGVFPPCANLLSLTYLHLQGNEFMGPLPYISSRKSGLVTMDIRDNKFSGEIPRWISSYSNLRVLLLKGNSLEGSISQELCQLRNLSILDLSSNNFSGLIPSCFHRIPFGGKRPFDDTFYAQELGWTTYRSLRTYSFESELQINQYVQADFYTSDVQEEIEFISKSRLESYKGNILYYISGIDLSMNRLTGPIPTELGKLSSIHTLNLSHNSLTGVIPTTFSNLHEIQSLDLSHNKLSGEIPTELINLNFLSVFSVAYNNLSGKIPDRKAQFATFEDSSYEGNPLLRGPPLEKGRTRAVELPSAQPTADFVENDPFKESFCWSFIGSYIVAFIGVIFFLYFYGRKFSVLSSL